MVNRRRRAATTLGCCFAVTVAAASHDNTRRHGNGRTVRRGMIAASMNENILAAASSRMRSGATRRRGESTRLPGVMHQKGHSFNDAENEKVIISTVSTREEQPDEQDRDASSSSPPPFLMLGAASQTTAAVLSPPEEEPATALSPYTALQIRRIGGAGSTATRDPTRHPYMASLQIEGASPAAGKFDYHMCTGFLIAPDLVMSAAHCAEYTPPGSDETYQAFNGIEVGRINLTEEAPYDAFDSSTYRLNYENLIPERVVKHPKYDAFTMEHDIMIVKVFGKSRFPYLRVDSDGVVGGRELTALGWGAETASSSKKYSDELREADLLVMDNDDCRSTSVRVTDPATGATAEATLADNIFDDMVCATARNRYVCHGDGGGPAVIRGDSPSQDAAAAVVSWGYGCVDPDYPAVMIRTADHFPWIRTVVCKESADPPEQYACPGRESMALQSSSAAAPKQTVTLKLKLDMMAVETGFVIVTAPVPRVIAQRTPGYYRIRENQIVRERMDLPSDQCYKLILLDSFGDGFCCDMGGGSATLYLGTDTGFYTGRVLAEVNGKFQYDASGEFCLDSSTTSSSSSSEAGSTAVMPSGGSASSSSSSNSGSGNSGAASAAVDGVSSNGTDLSTTTSNNGSSANSSNGSSANSPNGSSANSSNGSANNSNYDTNDNQGEGTSGWTGPAMNPEFEYCNQFCNANPNALNCGSYTCYHSEGSTSDFQENDSSGGSGSSGVSSGGSGSSGVSSGGSGGDSGSSKQDEDATPSSVPFDPEGHAADPAEYHLTVQFQFDDKPQDVSWVLYDLTESQVKMFVDFDVYKQEDFANQILEVVANVDGPEAGEKKYAFTVYDKSSDGLCCEHGEGYYKLFLGDVDDNLELLGDSEYQFSSSYYFTLFEQSNMTENVAEVEGTGEEEALTDAPIATSVPTTSPVSDPTAAPSRPPISPPSKLPTESPTLSPTNPPTTPRPTFPWEVKRSELMDEIGARWNTASVTPPDGKFNDLGGDQRNFDFTVGSPSSSGGQGWRIRFGLTAMVLAGAVALL